MTQPPFGSGRTGHEPQVSCRGCLFVSSPRFPDSPGRGSFKAWEGFSIRSTRFKVYGLWRVPIKGGRVRWGPPGPCSTPYAATGSAAVLLAGRFSTSPNHYVRTIQSPPTPRYPCCWSLSLMAGGSLLPVFVRRATGVSVQRLILVGSCYVAPGLFEACSDPAPCWCRGGGRGCGLRLSGAVSPRSLRPCSGADYALLRPGQRIRSGRAGSGRMQACRERRLTPVVRSACAWPRRSGGRRRRAERCGNAG